MGAAALLPNPGVLVRADTKHGVNVRLVDLARRHGWTDPSTSDHELMAAGYGRIPVTALLDSRLTQAGREALNWLSVHATPVGMELIDYSDLIVMAPQFTRPRTSVSQSCRVTSSRKVKS